MRYQEEKICSQKKNQIGNSEKKKAYGEITRESDNNIHIAIKEIGCDCGVD